MAGFCRCRHMYTYLYILEKETRKKSNPEKDSGARVSASRYSLSHEGAPPSMLKRQAIYVYDLLVMMAILGNYRVFSITSEMAQ